MVHIIGVNHDAQSQEPDEALTEAQITFVSCLGKAIRDISPQLIAEEDNEQFLQRESRLSLAKPIANTFGLEHRFCDPNDKERACMGYKQIDQIKRDLLGENLTPHEIEIRAAAILIGKYYGLREQFWLNRLNEFSGSEIVFICGDVHIDSFGRLLDQNDISHRTLQRRIGVTDNDTLYYDGLRYLQKHREVIAWYETTVLYEPPGLDDIL